MVQLKVIIIDYLIRNLMLFYITGEMESVTSINSNKNKSNLICNGIK